LALCAAPAAAAELGAGVNGVLVAGLEIIKVASMACPKWWAFSGLKNSRCHGHSKNRDRTALATENRTEARGVDFGVGFHSGMDFATLS
jgi:hypothetical protein